MVRRERLMRFAERMAVGAVEVGLGLGLLAAVVVLGALSLIGLTARAATRAPNHLRLVYSRRDNSSESLDAAARKSSSPTI